MKGSLIPKTKSKIYIAMSYHLKCNFTHSCTHTLTHTLITLTEGNWSHLSVWLVSPWQHWHIPPPIRYTCPPRDDLNIKYIWCFGNYSVFWEHQTLYLGEFLKMELRLFKKYWEKDEHIWSFGGVSGHLQKTCYFQLGGAGMSFKPGKELAF